MECGAAAPSTYDGVVKKAKLGVRRSCGSLVQQSPGVVVVYFPPPQGVSSLAREIKRLRRGERLDLKGRVDGGVSSIPYDDIAIVKDVVRYNYVYTISSSWAVEPVRANKLPQTNSIFPRSFFSAPSFLTDSSPHSGIWSTYPHGLGL